MHLFIGLWHVVTWPSMVCAVEHDLLCNYSFVYHCYYHSLFIINSSYPSLAIQYLSTIPVTQLRPTQRMQIVGTIIGSIKYTDLCVCDHCRGSIQVYSGRVVSSRIC